MWRRKLAPWFAIFVAAGLVISVPQAAEAINTGLVNSLIRQYLERIGLTDSEGNPTETSDTLTVTHTGTTTDAATITADNSTTGTALRITSTSTDTGTRDMFELRDDSGGFSSNTSLANWFTQSNTTAFTLDHNGGGSASVGIFLDHAGAGAALKATQSLSDSGDISCVVASSTNSGAGEAFAIQSTAGRVQLQGGVQLQRYVEASTATVGTPQVLTVAESGTLWLNTGATEEVHFTLPTAVAGLTYSFSSMDSDGLQVNCASGDTVTINGATSATAGYVSCTGTTSTLTITAMDDTSWCACASIGDWDIDGEAATSLSGGFYWSSSAATANESGVPIKAAGTTTAQTLRGFSHTSNRLTYDGIADKEFVIVASISATKASGGAALGSFYVYENGSVVTGSEIQRSISNTTDTGAFSLTVQVTGSTDDYWEIWCSTPNGDDLTFVLGNVQIFSSSRN